MASFTAANPQSGQFIDATTVNLTAFVDATQTMEDPAARIFYQRYVQSATDVFDVTSRFNLAGMDAGCIHVRFFDPDGFQTTLYTSPDECSIIAIPIERTDTALQTAYDRGDFSIVIEGLDAVKDLGFEIKSLYQDNGDPIPFVDFVPGNIYVDPLLGMFMFFHYPDKWDSGCSYWGFSWWDNTGLNEFPYVSLWDDESNGFGPGGVNPGSALIPYGGQGWEEQNWDNVDNLIALNTYWDTVSEAPTEEARVLVAYWTQDSTDPLEPRGGGVPDPDNLSNRSRLFTSPVTVATDTQLRFRSVDALNNVEDTKVETYRVGLRINLNRGINLISQPREVTGPEQELETAFVGLDLLQIFRLEAGLWQVFAPNSGILNDFETIDNQHGLFVVMNGPGTFCFPYGENPETTTLSLVDRTTNQGINAVGIPRSGLADNSIDNLLVSRDVEFDEIHRVTDGVFETFIPTRPEVLNFSPAELTPGRGYAIVTSKAQTFELPFID